MNSVKTYIIGSLTIILLLTNQSTLHANDGIEVVPGADFVSRYLWRGLMINDAPNIQPSITMGISGFEMGLWGSSTLSKTNEVEDNYAFSHEVDLWASYSYQFKSGMTISAVVTDYYFPNAGLKLGNFNNYDNDEGAGAHIVESGLIFSGPEKLPIGFSAYINMYNDEGKNTYFQVDYSTTIKEVGLEFIIGATGGSSANVDYYGTESFDFINMGFTASREIKITDNFSLPLFVNYTLNPVNEVSYLVFGFSL